MKTQAGARMAAYVGHCPWYQHSQFSVELSSLWGRASFYF